MAQIHPGYLNNDFTYSLYVTIVVQCPLYHSCTSKVQLAAPLLYRTLVRDFFKVGPRVWMVELVSPPPLCGVRVALSESPP